MRDRRSARPGLAVGGGLGTLLLLALALLFGGDAAELLGGVGGSAPPAPAEGDEASAFVGAVLGSTEDVWHRLLAERGASYREPVLELFSGATRSGCGFASAQVGPFYCPTDETVHLDLSFFATLARRHDAPGDFAQAYVIGHEVGHHVQNVLGIMDRVRRDQARASEREANELSVRLELQADFLAGVWAHHADALAGVIEPGDVEEALRAAAAVGDDVLQRQAGDVVSPETFTHGTAEQRARWFRRGLESGDLGAGDTFAARSL